MYNTTFSNMSYPDLDITLEAYKEQMISLIIHQHVIEGKDELAHEAKTTQIKIDRLRELINQASLVRGCVDQHING